MCTNCRIDRLDKTVSNHWAFTCNCARFGFNSVLLHFFNALLFDKLASANSEPIKAMFSSIDSYPSSCSHTHTHSCTICFTTACFQLGPIRIIRLRQSHSLCIYFADCVHFITSTCGETEVLARVHHHQHQHLILIGWSSFLDKCSMLQTKL